jgi:hypothetical protein
MSSSEIGSGHAPEPVPVHSPYALTVWLTALFGCMRRRKELTWRGIDTGRARVPWDFVEQSRYSELNC